MVLIPGISWRCCHDILMISLVINIAIISVNGIGYRSVIHGVRNLKLLIY